MKKKNSIITKFIIFILLIVIATILILGAMARYESQTSAIGEIDVALYILEADYQSMDLKLDNMIPRMEPYIYNFSISNYKNTKRTDVDIEYDLKIRTTTNLPLEYELYLNQNYNDPDSENIIAANTVEIDSDGTFFRTITTDIKTFGYTQNQTNLYQLLIYFPETYKTVQYQDIIESIEIMVESRQIIEP